jgi:hypothetical protein
MEFLLSKMIPEFVQAATRLEWSWEDTFDQFHRVLEGSPRTTWAEVLDTLPDLKHLGEAGFQTATDHLIKKLLNNNFPRDQQWIYLAPGGDPVFCRDFLTSPNDHLRRFNEMIRISKLLPAGNIADPTPRLQVQWLYMSYHRLDRAKYVESGKVLESETLETLTAYFQAIHDQKVSDGTLRKQLEANKKREERSNNNNNNHQGNLRGYSNREDRRGTPKDNYRDRDCSRESSGDWGRERSREPSGNYRGRGSQSCSHRSHSTPPKSRSGPSKPCPEHSHEGQPARHTWAECSRNPVNKKPPASGNRGRGQDSHHADARSPSRSSSRSSSPWSDSDSRGRSPLPSERDDASVNSADNFAVTEAPKSARNGKHRAQQNKRRHKDYKSSSDPIPRKHSFKKHEDAYDSASEDGYAAEARDGDNPLDC